MMFNRRDFRIQALEKEIKELREINAAIIGQFSKLNQDIGRLEGTVDALRGYIMGFQAKPAGVFDVNEMAFLEKLSTGGANQPVGTQT